MITKVAMTFVANTFYYLKVRALGSHLSIFVGDARQPVVDVDDHHFPNGMIGVRDYCGDGNQSFSSYAKLAVVELDSNGHDGLMEPAKQRNHSLYRSNSC